MRPLRVSLATPYAAPLGRQLPCSIGVAARMMAFFGCGGPVGYPRWGQPPPAVVVPPTRRKNAGGVNPHFGRRRVGVPSPRRVGVSAGPCPAHWSWLGGALLLVGTMRRAGNPRPMYRRPSAFFILACDLSGACQAPSAAKPTPAICREHAKSHRPLNPRKRFAGSLHPPKSFRIFRTLGETFAEYCLFLGRHMLPA